MKNRHRILSAVLAVIMLLAVFPFSAFPVANAKKLETVRDYTVGAQLDYSALKDSAYIIVPSLDTAGSVSFYWRGTAVTETYSASRHFATAAEAVAYYNAKETKEATPVFYFAPGTHTEGTITLPQNAIVLGNNAGINPNTEINFDLPDVTAGWAASTRNTETVIQNGFIRSGSENADSTVIIDGISYEGTGTVVTVTDTSDVSGKTAHVKIQNSLISGLTTASLFVDASGSSGNTVGVDLLNTRITGTECIHTFSANTEYIHAHGVYFYENYGNFIHSTNFSPYTLNFDIYRSYFYKNSISTENGASVGTYKFAFTYTNEPHNSTVNIDNSLFYETTPAAYGSFIIKSTANNPKAKYEVNIIDNTFLVDGTYNTGITHKTFLNGNASYQLGKYTLNVNRNRIIGWESMFPNIGSADKITQAQKNTRNITCDFNDNYFASTFTSVDDVLGTRSEYLNFVLADMDSTNYNNVDYARTALLNYYSDYAMTLSDETFKISGASFYSEVDYLSINNGHASDESRGTTYEVHAGMKNGTVTNPTLYFENDAVECTMYTDADCTAVCTSFSAPARETVDTYYAKASVSGTEFVIPVYIYGENAVPEFKTQYSDLSGTVSNSAYLLSPAAVTDGETIEVTFDNKNYLFTVGENAFDDIADIFSIANDPQIILANETHGILNITENCQIVGQNRRSAPYVALQSGVSVGTDWTGGKSPKVNGMVIADGVTSVAVSGVTFTADITAKNAVSLNVKNSVFDSAQIKSSEITEYINVTGCAAKNIGGALITGVPTNTLNVTDTYFMSGVKVTDGKWTVEDLTSTCTYTVSGCRFDDISSTVISDISDASSPVGINAYANINENFFGFSGTVPAINLTVGSYSRLSMCDNIFVSTADTDTPVSFDSATPSSTTIKNNRFVGFTGIKASSSENRIDLSDNYFAPYSEEYEWATKDGTVPTGNINVIYTYVDYAMTTRKKAVAGYSFTDIATVENTVVTVDVAADCAAVDLADIVDVGSCGVTLTDIDGNTVNTASIPTTYAVNPYTLTLYNKAAPGQQFTYALYINKTVDGCGIDYITASNASVYNENGVYRIVLPATEASTDITVAPSGTAALYYNGTKISRISNMANGESRSYTVKVTNGSSSLSYLVIAGRELSSGINIDYDAALKEAYVVIPSLKSGAKTVSFAFRGKTYTETYDASRHFASFDAAYKAYKATGKNVISDTPVFLLTAGDHGDIELRGRAIVLGSNAGINPNDPDISVSSFDPYTTPEANSRWDSENVTRILGSVRYGILDGDIDTAEKENGRPIKFYTVIDGIEAVGNAAAAYNLGGRAAETYIQNVKVANKANVLYTDNGTGTLNVRNARIEGCTADTLISSGTSVVFELSVVTGCGFTSLFKPRGSLVLTNNVFSNSAKTYLVNAANSGDITLTNNMAVGCGSVYTTASALPVITHNTFICSGADELFSGTLSTNATVENNRIIGYTGAADDNYGINYTALNFFGRDDALGLDIGDDSFADYALTTKYSDFDIVSVQNQTGAAAVVGIDNDAKRIDLSLSDNGEDTLTFAAKGTYVEMSLTNDASGVTSFTVDPDDSQYAENYYTLTQTKNGITSAKKVVVTAQEVPFFTDSNGVGVIENTASLIDPEVAAFADGTVVVREWRGKKYRFTVGQNVFSTLEKARSAVTGHLQAMLPAAYLEDELVLTADTSVYGVNFDIDPNVQTGSLGDDWAKNSDWGKWGESEVVNVSVAKSATGTLVELYGITLRGRIYDGYRVASSECTEFNIYNMVISHDKYRPTIYGGRSNVYAISLENSNSSSGTANCDKGLFKNIRIEKLNIDANTAPASHNNRILDERLPAYFTIDGMYCDMTAADARFFGYLKMSSNQTDGSLTIQNCNFRNAMLTTSSYYFLLLQSRGSVNGTVLAADDTTSLTATVKNCTFYDVTTTTTLRYPLTVIPGAYNQVNITDNLFLTTGSTGTRQQITFTNPEAGYNPVVIKRNRFVNTSATITLASGYGATLDLSGNYYAGSYSDSYKTAAEEADGWLVKTYSSKISGTNATNNAFYIDYALTTLTEVPSSSWSSYPTYSVAFGNGMSHDREKMTLSLSRAESDGLTLTIGDYVTSNSGHTVTVNGGTGAELTVGKNVLTVNVSYGSYVSDDYTLTVDVYNNETLIADLIEQAKEIMAEDWYGCYTESSRSALETAYNTALTAAASDSVYSSLSSAISGLTPDSALLTSAVNSAPSNDDGKYTAASYAALTSAISSASSATAEGVYNGVNSVNTAIFNLVDVSEYTSAIAAAQAVTNGGRYDTSAFALFAETIDAIESSTSIVTKADVDRALTQIENAYAVLTANFIDLNRSIAIAQAIDTEDITTISKKALVTALKTAKALKSDATQTDVDSATLKLNNAITGVVDQSEYNEALANAKAVTNYGKYSDEVWTAFTTTIEEIEASAAGFASDADVKNAVSKIAVAIASLSTDTTALASALERADAIDTASYSLASVTVFETALKNAKAVKAGATQDEVDALTYALETSMKKLVDKTPLLTLADEMADVTNDGNIYCAVGYNEYCNAIQKAIALADTFTNVSQLNDAMRELKNAKTLLKTHGYSAYKSNGDATCKTLGTETSVCSECGKTLTRTVPDSYAAHNYANYVSNGDATCKTLCTETGSCTWCGKSNAREIQDSLAAHSYHNYKYNNDESYAKDGTKTGVCRWCGVTNTVTVSGTKLTVTPVDASDTFTDIVSTKWYADAVNYVVGAGFIKGMTKTEFGPDVTLTRGMFVTILCRVAGVEVSNKVTSQFTDVKSGRYYAGAIKWAADAGIVSGITATTFEPNTDISRQQLCVMIVNFSKAQGIEITPTEDAITFTDADMIQKYAKDAVTLCQRAGIVSGYADGDGYAFKPRGNATRAEAAQILYKFHKDFVCK